MSETKTITLPLEEFIIKDLKIIAKEKNMRYKLLIRLIIRSYIDVERRRKRKEIEQRNLYLKSN